MTVRILPLLILLLPVFSNAADTPDSTTHECLERLERETRVGDSITVFTKDNRIIRGERPIVNFESSILYMKLMSEPGSWEDVTVPFDRINRITFRKQGHARWGMTVLGLVLGGAAGAAVGVALAP
ncbi:MAG: hypothetical protein GY867_03755 [bacterium]|nr:hypothetical protein [bacterium]